MLDRGTAWFVLGRLREACKGNLTKLRDIVEIDETFVGGIEANKHEWKKLHQGRGAVGKEAVFGMNQEDGRTIAMHLPAIEIGTVHQAIIRNVEVGSTIHSNEAGAYNGLGDLFFTHERVDHSAGEFARDGVSTNSIESVWAVLKRGVHGVFHYVSPKHLDRYVQEFTLRLNDGNVARHTLARLDSFIADTAGRRLTYKALIA